MAIYFAQLVLIILCGLFGNVNRSDLRRKIFVIFSFGLMFFIAGMRSNNIGIDLAGHYAKNYELIALCSWNDIPSFAEFNSYELGYTYFCKLISYISGDAQFYILVTSLITYGAMAFFIYRNSVDVVYSTLLFIFTCTYYMYMTMLRQAIAISIILVGYELVKNMDNKIKKYILFTVVVLFAYCFHGSAILCIVFILIDMLKISKKQVGLIAVAVVGVYLFYDKAYGVIISILGAGNNYERYLISATEGMGNINIQTIINLLITAGAFIIGFYYLVWKKNFSRIDFSGKLDVYSESFILYMGLLASVCRLLIFRMNIINRFTYYFIPFTFILYPYVITAIKNRINRRFFYWFILGVFFLYFLWMTFKYAGQFYGVIPYEFFWTAS